MGKEKFVFIGFTAALGLVLIPIYVVPKINPDAYSKLSGCQIPTSTAEI